MMLHPSHTYTKLERKENLVFHLVYLHLVHFLRTAINKDKLANCTLLPPLLFTIEFLENLIDLARK